MARAGGSDCADASADCQPDDFSSLSTQANFDSSYRRQKDAKRHVAEYATSHTEFAGRPLDSARSGPSWLDWNSEQT